MGKKTTSVLFIAFFLVLNSALARYWNNSTSHAIIFPAFPEDYSGSWQSSPLGIFTATFTDPASGATVTAAENITASTDPGECSAEITVPDVSYSGTGISWTMTGAHSGSGDGQVGTFIFSKGQTTITYTVTDSTSSAEDVVVITVTDDQKPTINTPTDVSVNTDSNNCTASGVSLGTPTTSDNCGVKNVANDAPSVFPLGTTTVTWTVTDDSDNTQTATQTVTVKDTQKPTISAPADKTVNSDNGKCTTSGVSLGTPTTSDNCGVKNVANDAPSVFPLGTTTVTWTVTDDSDNTQTATQTVTVKDTQKPTISAPADKTVNSDNGKCTASGVSLGTPTTSDNCGVKNVANDAPSVFPLGTTTVTWTVTDDSDNTQTATQTVTVKDTQKPTISAPADKTVNSDNGKCTASGVSLGTPTTSDNCGVKNVANDAPSVFPLGTTTVTWTVTDDSDNTQTATQTVVVSDIQKPTISAPADIAVNTDANRCSASGVSLGTPTTNDNCGIASVKAFVGGSEIDPATYEFPIGTTTVKWTVTDNAGLQSSADQQVIVTDNEIPNISAPANRTANTSEDGSGNCTTTVSLGTPTTNDNCGIASVKAFVGGSEIDPATYEFPIGTTTVKWTVTDNAGLQSSADQKVVVTDNENPNISAPANRTANTSEDGSGNCTTTVSLGTPTTNDNCGIASVKAFVGGSEIDPATYEFPIGTTTVKWTVTDNAGLQSSADQQVIVTDNEIPSISAPANRTANTSEDGSGNCTTTVSLGTPTTNDNCGIASVKAFVGGSEIDPATYEFPIGTTTVKWTVTDNAGLQSSADQQVIVTDNEKPTITAPSAKTVNTSDDGTGNCSTTTALGSPSVNDNCEVNFVKAYIGTTEIDPTTYQFPVGKTTVTWKVTDKAGLQNSATQDITVKDDELPIIAAVSSITASNKTGYCSASVTITAPTATDNCGVGAVTGIRSDGLALTQNYPVGTTFITWKVSDSNGNPSTEVTQEIFVEDKEAPAAPEVEDITWGCDYTVAVPSTNDNCDTEVTVTHDVPLTFTSSGTITWTFTDDAGNSSTSVQNIIIDPVQISAENVVDVLCNGYATGEIKVAASGGVGPYTFNWNNLGAGDYKTDLPAGTYSVTAIDANGCETAPLEITIDEPDTFIDITGISTTSGCFQQNNGTATVEATGGTGAYTYKWDNGDHNQTGQTATNFAPGEHSVAVTDANGCSKTRSFTISAPQELKVTGFLTTETTYFGSETGTATAQISGGTPNYTFRWSDGQTGQTAKDLSAGTYTVTVSDANGCSTTGEVEVIDALSANIIPRSLCEGDNVIRTSYFDVEGGSAIGGTPPYTYSWDFGENANPATGTGPVEHTVVYGNIGDKLITLTVTDSKGREFQQSIIQYVGGCFADDCGSNDLGLEDYFVGDANQQKITKDNCSTTGQKYIYIIFPSEPHRYSLQIELIYSVQNLETGEISNYRVTDCFYNQEYIPDIAQTFAIDYECGDIVKVEGIYLTFQNNINRECGTTQGNGNNPKCYSTNNEATVSSPLYAVAFPNELLCNGAENGSIRSRASGGTGNYSFQLFSTADNSPVGSANDTGIFEGLKAGKYKVVVNDGEESYTTREVEIKQPLNPLTISLTSTTNVTCFGGSNGSATVTATGGTPNTSGQSYIYSWENIGQTSATATNLSAGTYTVRVLDANGCEQYLDVVIEEPAKLTADAGPDQVLACGNYNTTLAAVFNPEVQEGEEPPVGTWSIINGPSGGSFADVHDPHTTFIGAAGTYTLRWSVPCDANDDVKITFSSCSKLDFDGVDDHVLVGNKFDLPSSFTLEAWVKQDVAAGTGVKTILSKKDVSAADSGFALVLNGNVPEFRYNSTVLASSHPIAKDRWYHIAVVTGGSTPGIFIDGIRLNETAPGQPTASTAPFIIGATYDSQEPTIPKNYFHGWIEEVRIWEKALDTTQLHFLMNQRLDVNSSPLKGHVLPKAVPGGLSFSSDIIAYYQLLTSEITSGITKDKGPGAYHGKLINITTNQRNTAPLPYISAAAGDWKTRTTWDLNIGKATEKFWTYPNDIGVDGTPIDWNIAKIDHLIKSDFQDITLLGLLQNSQTLDMEGQNPTRNASGNGQPGTGNGLTITHYLKMDGKIDLNGESQLIQSEGSELAGSGTLGTRPAGNGK